MTHIYIYYIVTWTIVTIKFGAIMSMVRGQDALFGILVPSINPHFIISLIFFLLKSVYDVKSVNVAYTDIFL